MNDLASGTFIEKIPNWLRWILVIPAAVIAPFLFLIIQAVFSNFYGSESTDSIWFKIIRQVVWGGGFVLVGSLMAPKKQFFVSIIFLIIVSVFVGVSIFAVTLGYGDVSPLESILGYLLNLGAAAVVVYYLHQLEIGEAE